MTAVTDERYSSYFLRGQVHYMYSSGATLYQMEYLAFGLSPEHLIQSGGILLIAAIIFAESGLLVGFFLPGDTLLFTAGFFAGQDKLSLAWLLFAVIVAAVAGDNVGYSFGRRLGPRIFKKEDGIIFRREYLIRAEKFYEAHGGKTIILARFIPIVRTFAPIVAGAAKMTRRKFFTYNIVGGVGWGVGVTLLGVWLGSRISNIDKYLFPIMITAVTISSGPAIWHVFKDPVSRQRMAVKINRGFRRFFRRIGLNRDLDV